MRVVITGAAGFLGWHIRCALHAEGHETLPIGRDALWSTDFPQKIATADVIVHAAGVNRGTDEDVHAGNIQLASRLAESYRTSGTAARLIYLNSTHIFRSSPYGESKARSAEILAEAAGENLSDLVLPNIFGEFGRPFYNSVASTFCHQIVSGLPLTINDDAPLEVLHAQVVADEILALLGEWRAGRQQITGHATSVVSLADDLRRIHRSYEANILPATTDSYERSLFNTLRSYGIPEYNIHELDPKHDDRGHLVELVKTGSGGQLFVSWTKPGITRGNHFHRRKVERFIVLEGEARIRFRRMFTDEITEVSVRGDKPVSLDIPTLHTHEITNTGTALLLTGFWTDEIFDPNSPETYAEVV
jgi:UDP-2-acetamido-2,6-beta-L-arabino-hexul-4-ose reductase